MKTLKKRIKTCLCLLFLLLCLPSFLAAQAIDQGPTIMGGPSRTGTAAAQFLQIGVSPRGAGLGDAYVALVNDASGAFYNPGALALLDQKQAFFSHTDLPAGIAHYFGSFVSPFGSIGNFALSFTALTTGDIPVTVANKGPTGENFSVSQIAVGLTYSRRLTNFVSFGATAKFVAEDLAGFENRTVAFDLGVLYLMGYRNARLGMSITNFGPDVTYGKDSEIGFESQHFPMPLTFRFGAALDLVYSDENKLWLTAEVHQPNDNLRNQSIGLEYVYNDLIFLRGGLKIDEDNDSPDAEDQDGFAESFGFGAGINLSVSGINGMFDVSWTQMSYLDDLLRFSVALSF